MPSICTSFSVSLTVVYLPVLGTILLMKYILTDSMAGMTGIFIQGPAGLEIFVYLLIYLFVRFCQRRRGSCIELQVHKCIAKYD